MSPALDRFEAINVVITRENDEDYEIVALNEDNDTKEFTAGALNLNGYAFATSGMSIGEYRRTVIVEQESQSRYVNLIVGENVR